MSAECAYKTVKQSASDEFCEKRSRFIGYAKPVKTQAEAAAFIAEIQKKHWDAKHNVYAYILREGGVKRYSDDGEPQGTAGVPVLDVLENPVCATRQWSSQGTSAECFWVRAGLCVPIPMRRIWHWKQAKSSQWGCVRF